MESRAIQRIPYFIRRDALGHACHLRRFAAQYRNAFYCFDYLYTPHLKRKTLDEKRPILKGLLSILFLKSPSGQLTTNPGLLAAFIADLKLTSHSS